jgi:hypothetical protein
VAFVSDEKQSKREKYAAGLLALNNQPSAILPVFHYDLLALKKFIGNSRKQNAVSGQSTRKNSVERKNSDQSGIILRSLHGNIRK